MAVYTQLSQQDIEQFLQAYFTADLLSQEAISAGTDNSNFKLRVRHDGEVKEYILTLFENMTAPSVEHSLQLLSTLYKQGLPVAAPVSDLQNNVYRMLADKPASLVPFFEGGHPKQANSQQCYVLGKALAQLHNVQLDKLSLVDSSSSVFSQVEPFIQQLTQELDAVSFWNEEERHLFNTSQALVKDKLTVLDALPRRLIHSDLFKDNVLFVGDQLSSILDFYDAHIHVALYDLAVTVNDWCFEQAGSNSLLLSDNYDSLIKGYTEIRALNLEEKQLWQPMLQLAALRFWLSRQCLMLKLQTQGNTQPENKSPAVFSNILQWHCENQLPL